jgi:hypothetical protein
VGRPDGKRKRHRLRSSLLPGQLVAFDEDLEHLFYDALYMFNFDGGEKAGKAANMGIKSRAG